jgi:hypothetical protein
MAKKKTITSSDILGAYMKYVLEHGEHPKSIYAFAQILDINETHIYDNYGSFEAIEKSIFKTFYDNTISLLDKNLEYQTFDTKNRLLSFYYTFFEVLKANRSYVVYALANKKNKLKVLSTLSSLKKAFLGYIEDIDIDTLDLADANMGKLKNRGIAELAWGQLLFTLKFWLEDDSTGFEKTDIFIEKSITTGFAMLDTTILKSVFDLGKFLIKEKMYTY